VAGPPFAGRLRRDRHDPDQEVTIGDRFGDTSRERVADLQDDRVVADIELLALKRFYEREHELRSVCE
jgi:hypothetical protein